MLAASLTSPSSVIRPWHVGEASTSTAKLRAKSSARVDTTSVHLVRDRLLGGEPRSADVQFLDGLVLYGDGTWLASSDSVCARADADI
jgi:hypothetical protein